MAKQPEEKPVPANEQVAKKRERVVRPFPSCSFEEAEEFARQVFEFASGNAVRRLLLFNHLDKSPESSQSRDIVTNSAKYGFTKGSYKAELLELTPEATTIFGERSSSKEKARCRVQLAIENIAPFHALYERFKDLKLPARAALVDAARHEGVPNEHVEEAVDTFLLNLKAVGLLQNLSGAERIIKLDHLMDITPSAVAAGPARAHEPRRESADSNLPITEMQATFESTCFYVTPIGDEGSEFRKHSDLFLSHIVEPALEQFKLKVVRADQIGKPGIISRQIFDYLVKSRLVIADLSFHNPNVFYELAVRHMLKRPVVQISRISDKIPFDISQMRTVLIDNTDIYSLLPKLELYKSEIATQARRALEESEQSDNPISIYYPALEVSLPNS